MAQPVAARFQTESFAICTGTHGIDYLASSGEEILVMALIAQGQVIVPDGKNVESYTHHNSAGVTISM